MYLRFCLDPYGRSPPFTPLGALGSSAFGGLGSPTLGQFYSFSALETHKSRDRFRFISRLSHSSLPKCLKLEIFNQNVEILKSTLEYCAASCMSFILFYAGIFAVADTKIGFINHSFFLFQELGHIHT